MIAHRENQKEKLRRALEEAPFDPHHPGGPGRWLALGDIMRLGIAQHGARLHELRLAGFEIENWREKDDASGTMKSWYRITSWPAAGPAETTAEEIAEPPEVKA